MNAILIVSFRIVTVAFVFVMVFSIFFFYKYLQISEQVEIDFTFNKVEGCGGAISFIKTVETCCGLLTTEYGYFRG